MSIEMKTSNKKLELTKEEFSDILKSMNESAKNLEKKEPKEYAGLNESWRKYIKTVRDDNTKASDNNSYNNLPEGILATGKFIWDSVPHVITVISEQKSRKEILEGKLSRDKSLKRAMGNDSQSFVSSKLISGAIKMGSNPNQPFSGDLFVIVAGLSAGTTAIEFSIANNNYNALKTILNTKGDVDRLSYGSAPINKIFGYYSDAVSDYKKPNGAILEEYIKLNRKMIQLLVIQKTKDVNLTNDNKDNALHSAANSLVGIDKEVYELLIKRGIDANKKNYMESTPLHIAGNVGNNEIIDVLKNMHADPNIQNKNGMTPLHLAALADEAVSFEKLINMGANPNIKDNRGKTPFYYFENDKSVLKFIVARSLEQEQQKAERKAEFIEKNRDKFSINRNCERVKGM